MEKPSTARIALKWGLIVAIVSIVFTTVIYMTDIWKNSWIQNICFLLLIPALVMAYKEFKNANHGFLNFGEGLGLGTLTSAVVGVITGLYGYIYMNFIDTTMLSKMLDLTREKMAERGMTDEQVEQAMQFSQKIMSSGFTFFIGIIVWIIVGFILSLIITAIVRKNKPEMDF